MNEVGTVALLFLFLGVSDCVIQRVFGAGAIRWPAIHAVGNAVVCMFAVPGVVATLVDPLHCMDSRVYPHMHHAASDGAMCAITAIHLYHVSFFPLTSADKFHHALFVPVICFFGHYMQWGALRQFLAFFICGLPGMLDYIAVCLYYVGWLTKPERRHITAIISVWLRAPGLLFEASMHYVALVQGTTTVPCAVNACIAALVVWNAMYYAASSVRSSIQ
jgi:hypothetical protein